MSKPIIPWMGGKTRLAKHVLPMIPDHQCYVEVFAGGAAIFYKKQPSKVEVLNDINGELVNLYRVVQHHLDEFVHHFKWALSSRQLFEWEKMKHPETLTDIQRAARFFYLQKLCFGGKIDGQTMGTATTSKPRINILRLEQDLSDAHLRLAQAQIEHLDWFKCIDKYDRDHSFFYLDPPYYETAGYGVDFDETQYQRMAEIMHHSKGKMLLSINDHSFIRETFNGFNMKHIDINYTVGGNGNASKAKELLISNW